MMKKKLALLLATIMCFTCLFTGCNNANPDGTGSEGGSSTQSDSGETSSEVVDINDLYKKGEYEGVDLSEYITLGDYAGIITLKESDYAVTKEEVQAEIDSYREAYGTTEEVKDRAVQEGDIVNIDYVGRIYGIKFIGGTAEDFDLEIGSGTFIDGFEDGLIGAKIGDIVEVKATFPEEYKNDEELAGKEAVFTVTVNSISVPVMAEYNDELVAKITNNTYKTVAEFDAYIEKQIALEKKANVLNKFLEELAKKSTLTEKANTLIDEKYKEIVDYYEQYAEAYGYTLANFAVAMGYKSEDELRKNIKEDATTEVQNSLVLYAYGNAIGFTLSDEIVLETAETIVELYGYEDVESLLADYDAQNVRAEAYNETISGMIVESYK